MAYIDYEYYSGVYRGSDIPSDKFDHIAEITSMTIDAIVYCQIDTTKDYMDSVKKAVAYEADTIYAFGGTDVVLGISDAAIGSESLGDYNYSLKGSSGSSSSDIPMYNGVPVSPITVSILSNAGLRRRWAYAYSEDGEEDA